MKASSDNGQWGPKYGRRGVTDSDRNAAFVNSFGWKGITDVLSFLKRDINATMVPLTYAPIDATNQRGVLEEFTRDDQNVHKTGVNRVLEKNQKIANRLINE